MWDIQFRQGTIITKETNKGRDKPLDLVAVLQQYIPYDSNEAQCARDTIEFLTSSSEPYSRSSGGHITAGGFIVDNCGQVLLNHHKKLNIWLQIGGHCDGDSQVDNVALREVLEETGLSFESIDPANIYNVAVFDVPYNSKYNEPAHKHYDVNYLFVAQTKDIVVSDESIDLQWVTIEEALQLIEPHDIAVRRMLTKYQLLLANN